MNVYNNNNIGKVKLENYIFNYREGDSQIG